MRRPHLQGAAQESQTRQRLSRNVGLRGRGGLTGKPVPEHSHVARGKLPVNLWRCPVVEHSAHQVVGFITMQPIRCQDSEGNDLESRPGKGSCQNRITEGDQISAVIVTSSSAGRSSINTRRLFPLKGWTASRTSVASFSADTVPKKKSRRVASLTKTRAPLNVASQTAQCSALRLHLQLMQLPGVDRT